MPVKALDNLYRVMPLAGILYLSGEVFPVIMSYLIWGCPVNMGTVGDTTSKSNHQHSDDPVFGVVPSMPFEQISDVCPHYP